MVRAGKIVAGAAALAAIAGGVVALIVAGSAGAPAPRPSPSALRSGSPSPTPTATSGPLVSPFTGERISSRGRVLAVKIDNIVLARPATGLNRADIVYAIPVEGGLSRLMAIFSSHHPRIVGPVRSAREDDIALLRQFGRPAFAYSGATPVLLPYIHQYARIVDLYAGRVGGYFRDLSRVAPYNLYAHTRQLLAEAPNASRARDIGFRFGSPPPGGKATARESVSYPAASFTFTWSAGKKRWLVWMDGARAMTTDRGQMTAATVVIQYTKVVTSRFREYGSRPPYARSTGSGWAVVLRNGKAWRVRWSRPTRGGGTTFTTASGRRMTFARGRVWVVLAYG